MDADDSGQMEFDEFKSFVTGFRLEMVRRTATAPPATSQAPSARDPLKDPPKGWVIKRTPREPSGGR